MSRKQSRVCPPHNYIGGWTSQEDDAQGVIFCTRCGDVLTLDPERTKPAEDRADWEHIKTLMKDDE